MVPAVSVVVSTYNRCHLLPRLLASLLEQAAAPPYEVVVVDNNSTDRTREVVESVADGRVRYVFEGRQGLSHGRNAGIAASKAPLIAFTDDDIEVAPDWIACVAAAFAAHPDVHYVGGRVLATSTASWPRWALPKENWAPMALLDHGEAPLRIEAHTKGVIGANFAFRREVFERVGPFSVSLQRVKDGIGSLEDHEMLLRCIAAGLAGLYVPALVVYSEVPPERLLRAYHRRWYGGHGHFMAMWREPETELSSRRVLGVPGHLCRRALADAAQWLRHCCLGRRDAAFAAELRLREFAGFFVTRARQTLGARPR